MIGQPPRARPRPGWRAWSARPGAWFAAFGALAAIVLMAIGGTGLIQNMRLAAVGQETEARIVGFSERTTRSGLTRSRAFEATVQFTDPRGETRRETYRVSRGFFGSHARGDVVSLRYLPPNPSIGELEHGRLARSGRVPIWLGLGFALLAALAGIATWRHLSPMRRAARRGPVIAARVVEHAPVEPPAMNWARIRWRDGEDVEGLTARIHRNDLPPLGSIITLYADPITGHRWWDGEY